MRINPHDRLCVANEDPKSHRTVTETNVVKEFTLVIASGWEGHLTPLFPPSPYPPEWHLQPTQLLQHKLLQRGVTHAKKVQF